MIRFKSISQKDTGYKYEVTETKVWPLGVKFLGYNIKTEFFSLIKGQLSAHKGYRFDGATGAIDTATFMAGSCKHDILTDMIRADLLPQKLWGPAANEMRITNKAEGMPWIRRQWTWAGVSIWGRIKRWLK